MHIPDELDVLAGGLLFLHIASLRFNRASGGDKELNVKVTADTFFSFGD